MYLDTITDVTRTSRERAASIYITTSQCAQVDVSVLAKAGLVQSWRTPLSPGSTEHTVDFHFCMPGPVDEMALLLTRLVWAHYLEKLRG